MLGRDEIIEEFKAQLDQLNQHLETLEANARNVSGDAQQKYEEQMSQLHELARPAQEKLHELRQSGEDQWQHLASEADKVYKAFVHSYNYFKSQLH